MIPEVIDAKHAQGYVLRLRFSDGTEGDVDLKAELHGEIFEPLKDPFYFQQFSLNQELHTITWPNGADFAPEFLYDKLHVAAQ